MSIVIQSVIAFVNCCSFARPSTGGASHAVGLVGPAEVLLADLVEEHRGQGGQLSEAQAAAHQVALQEILDVRWRPLLHRLAVEEPFQPLPSGDMPLMNHWCTKYRGRA